MNEVTSAPILAETLARFSVEEYLEIANRMPVVDWPGKVELVDGVMIHMPPPGYPHFKMQRKIFKLLDAIFDDGIDGWLAGQDLGTQLPGANVRIPDIVIFREPDEGAMLGLSERLLLALEISDTSLAADLNAKQASYALAGIPHYWVVDINARETHVMADPGDGLYRTRHVVPFGTALSIPGGYGELMLD